MSDNASSLHNLLLNDEHIRCLVVGLLTRCEDANQFEGCLKELARLVTFSQLHALPPFAQQLLTSAFDDIDWREFSLAIQHEHRFSLFSEQQALEQVA